MTTAGFGKAPHQFGCGGRQEENTHVAACGGKLLHGASGRFQIYLTASIDGYGEFFEPVLRQMRDDALQKVGRKIVQTVVAAVFKLPDSNGFAGA